MEVLVILTMPVVAVAGLGLFVLVAMAVHFSRTPCPKCARRGTVGWLNARRDGKPDRRYRDNYRLCRMCGWTSIDTQRAKIKADFEQLIERLRSEAEAEQRQQVAERVERAIVWLLKFIAVADRRFAAGERQAIESHIRRLFPEDRQERLITWVDNLATDSVTDLNEHLSNFLGLSADSRAALYRDLEGMAVADGKATKAEKDRLKQISVALGLTK